MRLAMKAGDRVTLEPESGTIAPDSGSYTVSRVNPDGSFHVGGNTLQVADVTLTTEELNRI